MNVVFRADASLDIGTGHVMRCLTLADALREHGARCRFVSRAHPGHLLDAIRARGYEALALGAPAAERAPATRTFPLSSHLDWLGADWQADAAESLALLGSDEADWLVVDHYAIDARWELRLRPRFRKVAVIDDLADRTHHCDLLLDQNLGRSERDYRALVPPGCTVLAGPRYALLRPEFAAARAESLRRRERPVLRQVLVTMGGVDRTNATADALEALAACELPAGCRIKVVMGSHAPWLADVRRIAARLRHPTDVLVDVSDMAALMAGSDIAIGAAGSTSWERCALGVPSLVVVLAENQRAIAEALDRAGAALSVDHERLQPALRAFLEPEGVADRMLRMSAAARAVTDGEGASRVGGAFLTPEHA